MPWAQLALWGIGERERERRIERDRGTEREIEGIIRLEAYF